MTHARRFLMFLLLGLSVAGLATMLSKAAPFLIQRLAYTEGPRVSEWIPVIDHTRRDLTGRYCLRDTRVKRYDWVSGPRQVLEHPRCSLCVMAEAELVNAERYHAGCSREVFIRHPDQHSWQAPTATYACECPHPVAHVGAGRRTDLETEVNVVWTSF